MVSDNECVTQETCQGCRGAGEVTDRKHGLFSCSLCKGTGVFLDYETIMDVWLRAHYPENPLDPWLEEPRNAYKG